MSPKHPEGSGAVSKEWTDRNEADLKELELRIPQLEQMLEGARRKQADLIAKKQKAGLPVIENVLAESRLLAIAEPELTPQEVKERCIALIPAFAKAWGGDEKRLREAVENAPDIENAIKTLVSLYGAANAEQKGTLPSRTNMISALEPFGELLGSRYSIFVPEVGEAFNADTFADFNPHKIGSRHIVRYVYGPGILKAKPGNEKPETVIRAFVSTG